MNYIGSKHKLSAFIKDSITKVVGNDLTAKTFCDILAGTGVIGRIFKSDVKQVISNDIEYYSYVLIRNYIGNRKPINNYEELLQELNDTKPVADFIYNNYCRGAGSDRQYFSDDNGKRIDSIRSKIEQWKAGKIINEDTYYFLLASLLESADKVANTASVYGAYLKHLKKSAQKKLIIKPAMFETSPNEHLVFRRDSNQLIRDIEGDILYLDPPYNARQYGANYHLLNTISKYDKFTPIGKTGMREYFRSDYCKKGEVQKSFDQLIKNAKFQYIFLSYNNEGLMTEAEIIKILSKYGKYDQVTKKYQRFKADKDANRNHKSSSTKEYLHILEKLS